MTATMTVRDARGDAHTLTPGVWDTTAEHVYLNGQCLNLAVAVNEAAGWPIVLHLSQPGCPVWADEIEHGGWDALRGDWICDFVHALSLTPNGTLVDAAGEWDPDGYLAMAWDRYGTSVLVVVPEGSWHEVLSALDMAGTVTGTHRPTPDEQEAARLFARTLVTGHAPN
jgi:hypothetical protein